MSGRSGELFSGYRMVVLTGERSHNRIDRPRGRGCMINMASNRNGVGYGEWTHIDGWSEAALDYLAKLETGQTAV